MIKTIVAFSILVFASIQVLAQDCNCTVNLDSLITGVEHNYIGFPYKVNDSNQTEYKWFKKNLLEESKTKKGYDCYYLLKRFTQYFKDPHFSIAIGTIGTTLDTNAVQTLFKNLPQKTIDEQSVRNQLTAGNSDGIEGIWQSPALKYRVAIVKDSTSRDGYLGYALGSDNLYWYNGQLKMKIFKKGKKLWMEYFRNDHMPDTQQVQIHNGWMRIDRYGDWGMVYPAFKPINQSNNIITVKSVGPNTVAISITDFTISKKKLIDSVLTHHWAAISKAKYLIVDLRHNSGGSILSFEYLMPLIVTGPVATNGFIVRSSVDNIESYRKSAANPDFSKENQGVFADIADTMEAHGDGLVTISSPDTIYADVKATSFPQKVAFLVDRGTVSAAEFIVLQGKQSSKVTVFGTRTRGALDYTEAYLRPLPCPYFVYSCPIGASDHTVTPHIDNTGITPDVEIPDTILDWTKFVIDFYSKSKISKGRLQRKG